METRYESFTIVPRDWHWSTEFGRWQPPSDIDPRYRDKVRKVQAKARQYDRGSCNWYQLVDRVGRIL